MTSPSYSLPLILALAMSPLAACGDDNNLDAPSVNGDPEYTNQNPYTLEGEGEAGATIEIRGGAGELAQGEVDRDGKFSVEVQLLANASNTLVLSQTEGGSESQSTVITLIHDDIAPDNPTVDPVPTPTRRKEIALSGSAEVGTEILIRGGAQDIDAQTDAMGRFSAVAPIDTEVADITERSLEIQARDRAGNLSGATSLSIVHNPALPIDAPILDPAPAYINLAQLDLTGLTEPDMELQVVANSTIDVVADSEGSFSAQVALEANASNHISVFALVSALGISSAPAQIVVIHDDIAPESPSVHPIPSPTGATNIRVSGTTEAFSNISVTGGAAAQSVLADSNGDFALDVTLTADSINALSITATDRAGNVSLINEATVEQDSNLDEPVSVDPQASPTSSSDITLTGSASPSTDVEILGGAAAVTVTSQADGSFIASVPLNENVRNELRVRHVGGSSETLLIVDHDNVAPDSPSVDEIPSPTNQNNIDVAGTSEPLARISVTGGVSPAIATADSIGRYSVPVTIEEDTTTSLLIIATDRAGNSSNPSSASVTHSSEVPDAPVVDDPSPAPQASAVHTLSGYVTEAGPGISIRITGGASTATGTTDEITGAFSVDVDLNTNSVNTLEVVSIEGGIESPPALVTVTHDDVAPLAVDGGAVSLGSPTVSSCVARTEQISVNGGLNAAEAFSTVQVVNASATGLSASTSVNADGSFATSILACEGDNLHLTSTDAAGNTSAVLELTVN